MRKLMWLLCPTFLCLVVSADATLFVVVRTSDGYIVGADSQRIVANNDKTLRAESVCKIRTDGRSVVFIWGSFWESARTNLMPIPNFQIIAEPFVSAAGTTEQKSSKLLEVIKQNDPFSEALAHAVPPGVGVLFVDSSRADGFDYIFPHVPGPPKVPALEHTSKRVSSW